MDETDLMWFSSMTPMIKDSSMRNAADAGTVADALERFVEVYPDADLRRASKKIIFRLRKIEAAHD